jgi:hypothetical protein
MPPLDKIQESLANLGAYMIDTLIIDESAEIKLVEYDKRISYGPFNLKRAEKFTEANDILQ